MKHGAPWMSRSRSDLNAQGEDGLGRSMRTLPSVLAPDASLLAGFSQSLWRVRHRGEDEMMGGWPLGCGRRSFLEPRARSQSGARPEGPGSVASSTNPRF